MVRTDIQYGGAEYDDDQRGPDAGKNYDHGGKNDDDDNAFN
jgi:hypothetical protein